MDNRKSGPNHARQQTAAAMLVLRDVKALSAAAAAELGRSAAEGDAVDEPVPTYSVSFRLQRTTTEFAFVSVPVTADLIIKQPDGTGRINAAKMVQRAVEMGQAAGITWQVEERQVQPHPSRRRHRDWLGTHKTPNQAFKLTVDSYPAFRAPLSPSGRGNLTQPLAQKRLHSMLKRPPGWEAIR